MAFCSYCGEKLKDGVKFCSSCGKPVSVESSSEEKRKTVFDGAIHKCSNCGGVLPSFVLKCPSCGYEIRSLVSNNSVSQLAQKIEELENKRGTKYEKKISLIRSFPIPNTKEDIIELCMLAYSGIDFDSYDSSNDMRYSSKAVSDAWVSLFERAKKKAKILLDGSDLFQINEMHNEIKSKIKKNERKVWKKLGIGLLIFVLFYGLIFLILTCAANINDSNKNEELKDNPNAIIINYSDNNLIGMQYAAVVELLEKQGFKNIILYETEIKYSIGEPGEVESITIDSDKYFDKGDYFLPDDIIVIYYYSSSEKIFK